MQINMRSVCFLFLSLVVLWHSHAAEISEEMTSDIAVKIIQCTYEKNIEICDGSIEMDNLYTCVRASLNSGEHITKDQLKQYLDRFVATRASMSDWQSDVIAGVSRQLYKNLPLIPEKFHSWQNVIISVAALRDLKGHQYLLLHCSLRKFGSHYISLLIAFKDCYESIVSMVTEGKNSKKVAVTAAKTKALGQKRFLALSIMRLLLEDWKDDEGDLRVVLEHLITFEFVPIDAVSKAIAKFVNMYTLALVEDYDHLQFSDKIEPIDLPNDPLLSFIDKAESAPFEVHFLQAPSHQKPDKISTQILFYVATSVIVVLLVAVSLCLVVYRYYVLNNISVSNAMKQKQTEII